MYNKAGSAQTFAISFVLLYRPDARQPIDNTATKPLMDKAITQQDVTPHTFQSSFTLFYFALLQNCCPQHLLTKF